MCGIELSEMIAEAAHHAPSPEAQIRLRAWAGIAERLEGEVRRLTTELGRVRTAEARGLGKAGRVQVVRCERRVCLRSRRVGRC